MSGNRDWITRIGAHLPGRSWDIPATDGTALDLTGFTAKLIFEHPDRKNVTLAEWATFTYDDAFPNLTIATFTTSPWAGIVTAWGKALPEHGSLFLYELQLTRTDDSKIWELPETLRTGTVRILPERVAA